MVQGSFRLQISQAPLQTGAKKYAGRSQSCDEAGVPNLDWAWTAWNGTALDLAS